MRVSHEAVTNSLGPGKRYVVWVQGCKKRCPGCINPEGWELEGGYEVSAEILMGKISACKGLTGITISGGEPFLQLGEVRELAERVKKGTELDVMLFSGYNLEELREAYGEEAMRLLELTDIFVDGEYVRSLNHNTMYRGSNNQEVYFFTEKYRGVKEQILSSQKRDFSFEVSDTGEVYFIGIPPAGFYEAFIERIGGQGDEREEGIRSQRIIKERGANEERFDQSSERFECEGEGSRGAHEPDRKQGVF